MISEKSGFYHTASEQEDDFENSPDRDSIKRSVSFAKKESKREPEQKLRKRISRRKSKQIVKEKIEFDGDDDTDGPPVSPRTDEKISKIRSKTDLRFGVKKSIFK